MFERHFFFVRTNISIYTNGEVATEIIIALDWEMFVEIVLMDDSTLNNSNFVRIEWFLRHSCRILCTAEHTSQQLYFFGKRLIRKFITIIMLLLSSEHVNWIFPFCGCCWSGR